VALGEAQQAIAASLTDDVAGLRTIKSFGAEGARAEKLEEQVRRLGEILASYAAAMGTARVLGLAFSAAACGALLLAAVAMRGVPLADALVLAGIAARLFAAMARARENWRTALHHAASYEALRHLSDEAPTALAPTSSRIRAPLANGIELRGLEFAHPGSGKPVLANIDAVLPAGGVILLTGPSGEGKSTLADLLAGLSAPTQGEIWIDGKALGAEDRASWRARVGYAAQDAFLFDDTVRANLRLANSAASEAAMTCALDLAAADFVRALPQGLDTRVGQRGVRLSAGERQRISLAAALLREPDFLILDETFAPLDPATAARVVRGLRSLSPATTILVVAHRAIPELAPSVVVRLEGGMLS
jgi:ATP-binding cassette subfamily C protein